MQFFCAEFFFAERRRSFFSCRIMASVICFARVLFLLVEGGRDFFGEGERRFGEGDNF